MMKRAFIIDLGPGKSLICEHGWGYVVYGIRCSDSTKEDMVCLAFFTWKLDIPLNPTELEKQADAVVRLEKLLEVNGVTLPKPKDVNGWTTDLQYLPTVTHHDIYSYLIDTPGTAINIG